MWEQASKMWSSRVILLYIGLWVCCMLSTLSALCPCEDTTLCEVIKDSKRKEVFLFSLQQNETSWLKYDWSKVTSVVTVGYMDSRLMCLAHKHKARVIRIANYPIEQLLNVSHSEDWIKQQITSVLDYSYDGINFDIEGPLLLTQRDLRDALTGLVNRTYQQLKAINKNYQITYDVAWNPHCVDNRCYDITALGNVTDFLFVMSYDERSQITGPCIAGPNSHYVRTKNGIQEYLNMMIPANKLVLGVPWYGYNYPCLSLSKKNVCEITQIPFRGVNCSDAAGKEYDFSFIMETMLTKSKTGRIWDSESQTPYFTYQENDGSVHQVWYDDPESLTLKYMLADQFNLHGVGMWNVDCVKYDDSPTSNNLRQIMWDALPKYN